MAKLATLFLFGLLALGAYAFSSEGDDDGVLGLGLGLGDGLGEGPLAKILGGEGDGPLADKPLLRMLLMRRIMGGGAPGPLGGGGAGPLGGGPLAGGPLGGPGPIARAMMANNVPLPLMRAMMMRRMAQGGGPPFAPAMMGGQQPPQLLRSLVLFRILGEKMGKRILEELENRITDARVYTFVTSLSCDCALEYVDADGNMAGFHIDLAKGVCEAAGKKCEVIYDASSNCYTHHSGEHSRAGIGILAKHYDGCLGWMKTHEREHSVAFTAPYWKEGSSSHFYVKSGNPKGFDPTNIQNSHIGFVDGWASDKICLKSHKDDVVGTDHLDDPNVSEFVNNKEELYKELMDEKIDAVFVLDSLVENYNHLNIEQIGEDLPCGSGHSHIMVRKDSHVPEWFDSTLAAMQESGKYYQLCRQAKQNHGAKGEINCLLPGDN